VKVTVSCFALDNARGKAAKELAESCKEKALGGKGKSITDFSVYDSGGVILLVLSHNQGVGSKDISGLSVQCAGVKPISCIAEMEFEEFSDESLLVFFSRGTGEKEFNSHVFNAYANPLGTESLLLDLRMHDGFKFKVSDRGRMEYAVVDIPEEAYDLASLISYGGCLIERVFRKTGESAACVGYCSMGQLLLARCGSGFPNAQELTASFSERKGRGIKVLSLSLNEGVFDKPVKREEGKGGDAVASLVRLKLKPRFKRI